MSNFIESIQIITANATNIEGDMKIIMDLFSVLLFPSRTIHWKCLRMIIWYGKTENKLTQRVTDQDNSHQNLYQNSDIKTKLENRIYFIPDVVWWCIIIFIFIILTSYFKYFSPKTWIQKHDYNNWYSECEYHSVDYTIDVFEWIVIL